MPDQGCRFRRGDNSKLRALYRIAGNGDAGRAVNQDPGGPITWWLAVAPTRWVYIDVVNHVVGGDRSRRAITYLNPVLGDGRSSHLDRSLYSR